MCWLTVILCILDADGSVSNPLQSKQLQHIHGLYTHKQLKGGLIQKSILSGAVHCHTDLGAAEVHLDVQELPTACQLARGLV